MMVGVRVCLGINTVTVVATADNNNSCLLRSDDTVACRDRRWISRLLMLCR